MIEANRPKAVPSRWGIVPATALLSSRPARSPQPLRSEWTKVAELGLLILCLAALTMLQSSPSQPETRSLLTTPNFLGVP